MSDNKAVVQLKETLSFFESTPLDMAELALSLAQDKVNTRLKEKEAMTKRLEKARAAKSATPAGASGGSVKPKRVRRTKEQIAADEAAKTVAVQQAANVASDPVGVGGHPIPAAPQQFDDSYDSAEEVVVQR